MAVALRSTATAASSTPGNSITVAKPTGLASNDLLLISVAAIADDASNNTHTISCTGFTLVTNSNPAGANLRGSATLYRYISDAASEPANYTVSVTNSGSKTVNIVAIASAWTGVDFATPIDVSASTQDQTSTSVIAATITPVTDNAMLVFHGLTRRALTFTPDAAMTEVADLSSTGGTSTQAVSAELAWQLLGTAAATGTRTATISGGTARENRGTLIALRPGSPPPAASAKVRVAGAWQTKPIKARVGGAWV